MEGVRTKSVPGFSMHVSHSKSRLSNEESFERARERARLPCCLTRSLPAFAVWSGLYRFLSACLVFARSLYGLVSVISRSGLLRTESSLLLSLPPIINEPDRITRSCTHSSFGVYFMIADARSSICSHFILHPRFHGPIRYSQILNSSRNTTFPN